MAYTKINWKENTPLNSTNLNKMETQYDEAFNELGSIRTDTSSPLLVQVVTSDPANNAGYMIYNSTSGQFKYNNGTSWQVMAEAGKVGL